MKKLLSILLMLSMLLSLCVVGVSASTTSANAPTDVTLNISTTQVIISWQNPVYTDNALTALKVYDGNGTVLASNFDLTSGKVQQYTHSGLTAGTVYNYKLEATFADGTTNITKFSAKTETSTPPWNKWLGGDGYQWNIAYDVRSGVSSKVLYAGIDNNELYNGSKSFILLNHTGANYGRWLLKVNFNNGLTANTKYKLEWKAKSSTGDGTSYIMGLNSEYGSGIYKGNGTSWHTDSVEFTPTSEAYAIYFCMNNTEKLWLNDFKLYKDNNGSWESADDRFGWNSKPNNLYVAISNQASITSADITNTATQNAITTAWNTSAGNFNSLKFYIKKAGESTYTYAGETANQTKGSFVYENLTPGTTYSVKTAKVQCGVEVDVKEESVSTPEPVSPIIPTVAPSEITIHTGATQIILSWRNPVHNEKNALTALAVYDGNGTVLSSSFSLTSGKVQKYTHTGLTTGQVYNYKLEATFADGTKYSTKLSTKTAEPSSDNWVGGDDVQWRFKYLADVGDEALYAGVDKNELYNNEKSFVLLNHTGSSSNSMEHLLLYFDKLTANTTYKLQFAYKATKNTNPMMRMNGWGDERRISGNGAWQVTEQEFTPTSASYRIYFVMRSAEQVWLNDFKLFQKNSDGSYAEVADYFGNGNPEKLYKQASVLESIVGSEITNTAEGNTIKTAWDSTAEHFSSLKFYIKKSEDIEYTYAGEVANQTAGNFVFENLELDQEYTVKTTRVINGVEFDVKEVILSTPKPVVADYSLKLGDREVNEISATGTYTASVTLTNNLDSLTGQLIVGVYDKKGVFVNTALSDKAYLTKIGETTELTTDIVVSDASYSVRMYLWDGIETLNPIYNPYYIFNKNWKGSGELSDSSAFNLVTTFYDDGGRGFAWAAAKEHTDMAIRYAKADEEWYSESVIEDAEYTEYNGRLYYKADIQNLESGESYVYKIGDLQDDVWSDFYTFTTEPENLTEFSFIGVTDPQSSSWINGFDYYKTTLDKAFESDSNAAFMVNLGDMVNDGTNQMQWDYYFDAVKGYAESVPHMAVVGNHETRGDAETAGKHYGLQFNNPQNGKDAIGTLTASDVSHECTKGVVNNIAGSVYSFDYGNAHFAVLNSGTDWSRSDKTKIMTEQAKWLEEDLGASDKKWKIVMVHMGMYPAKTERYDTRDELTEVIDKYGVDLVLSGHDHMVARTYPMRDKQIADTSNPASVIKGTGVINAILGVAGPKRYDEVTEIPSYLAFLNATAYTQPTYSIFDVNDERISVVIKQIDGTVVDSFEIIDE